MKKIILLLLLAVCTISVNAQIFDWETANLYDNDTRAYQELSSPFRYVAFTTPNGTPINLTNAGQGSVRNAAYETSVELEFSAGLDIQSIKVFATTNNQDWIFTSFDGSGNVLNATTATVNMAASVVTLNFTNAAKIEISKPGGLMGSFGVDDIVFTPNVPCTVNIPDANFNAYLVGNTAINTNGDTEIQCSEATAFTGEIDAHNLSISDMTGIESFINITTLQVQQNSIVSLDLTQNTALVLLFAQINPSLTSLNVSGCSMLSFIQANYANLATIDLTNTPSLSSLNLGYNVNLTSLDLSLNTNLINLNVTECYLNSLNVANGNNSNFTQFEALDNSFTCITVDDVAYSTANWTDIDTGVSFSTNCNAPCIVTFPDANFKAYLVSNTLINTNGDTEIQCSEASAFTGSINVYNKFISDLTGIEAFINLMYLNCVKNTLTSIDVTNNTALLSLHVNDNALTSIDVSNNLLLNTFQCTDNALTSIDISVNTALTNFACSDNSLSTLDVSNNTAIVEFWCMNNNLTALDVSSNTAITYLACYNNALTTLDLSNNIALGTVFCDNNALTSLNISNGNNTNIAAGNFSSTSNASLTCIQVDNVAYSTTNWTNIDPQTSFSTNCNVILVNSISVQGQAGATTITTQGGTLQMEATVLPANADDNTYTWSVTNGTGTATIDANGLLTALTDGTVTVTATANDASGITGTTIITISNQTLGINEVALQKVNIYPNPVKNQLFVELDNQELTEITIIDYSGRIVKTITNNTTESIDVSGLAQGIYMLKVSTKNGVLINRFVKN